jgi:hypothetical protein
MYGWTSYINPRLAWILRFFFKQKDVVFVTEWTRRWHWERYQCFSQHWNLDLRCKQIFIYIGTYIRSTQDVIYCRVFRGCVTTDGVWIGEWIYWQLVYATCNYILHITNTETSVLSLLHSPIAVSWLRLLQREILQLPVLWSLSSTTVQNSCQLTTRLTGSQTGGHFTLAF